MEADVEFLLLCFWRKHRLLRQTPLKHPLCHLPMKLQCFDCYSLQGATNPHMELCKNTLIIDLFIGKQHRCKNRIFEGFRRTSEIRGLNLVLRHFYRFNEFRQFFCQKTWILQFYVSSTKEAMTHVQVFLCSNLLSKLY